MAPVSGACHGYKQRDAVNHLGLTYAISSINRIFFAIDDSGKFSAVKKRVFRLRTIPLPCITAFKAHLITELFSTAYDTV